MLFVLGLGACSGEESASTPPDQGLPAAGGQGGGGGLPLGGHVGTGGEAGGAGGAIGGAGGGAGGATTPCTTHDDCPGGARCSPDDSTCHPACRNDFECGTSARCRLGEGFCEPMAPCAASGECGADAVCNCHGVCEPLQGANPCQTPLQCAVEQYCDPCSGSCKARVPPCGRCGETADACERRTDLCLPVGAAGQPACLRGCTGQPNCDAVGPGYECRELADGERACVPLSGECVEASACLSDPDCPPGSYCTDEAACRVGCTRDTECANGAHCVNLRCVAPCSEAEPCAAPTICQPDGRCAVPGGCLSSADCPERETHCDLSAYRCVPGCERDVDCLSAEDECVDGHCRRRGCTGNYQCAFAEVCELASGNCQPAGGRHCEAGCDPQAEASCGGGGNRCLSLQDQDGNDLGSFCFELCQPSPNECPQGYQCVALTQDPPPNPPVEPERLCIRRCDQEPI